MEGTLHPNRTGELRVPWYADTVDGQPTSYSVNAGCNHDWWLIESNAVSFEKLTDEEVALRRVIETLARACDAYPYQFAEFGQMKRQAGLTVMPDKRRLTVQLKPDATVDTILLDGKPDEIWNQLCADFEKNYKMMWKGSGR